MVVAQLTARNVELTEQLHTVSRKAVELEKAARASAKGTTRNERQIADKLKQRKKEMQQILQADFDDRQDKMHQRFEAKEATYVAKVRGQCMGAAHMYVGR